MPRWTGSEGIACTMEAPVPAPFLPVASTVEVAAFQEVVLHPSCMTESWGGGAVHSKPPCLGHAPAQLEWKEVGACRDG